MEIWVVKVLLCIIIQWVVFHFGQFEFVILDTYSLKRCSIIPLKDKKNLLVCHKWGHLHPGPSFGSIK